jgi:hypothetical protein
MDTEIDRLLNRSRCAKAVAGIYRAVAGSRCGGLAVPDLERLLAARYPASTVRRACVELHRLGAIVAAGTKRTRHRRTATVWRAFP